jgi:predicted nucleotidyltransferase
MTVRESVMERARRVVAERLLVEAPYADRRDDVAIVLCGSAVTEYADAYSGLDFLVLSPGSARPVAPPPTDGRAQRFRVIARGLDDFRNAAASGEDEALFLVCHGVVLHDPRGEATALWQNPPVPPAPVWEAKIADTFQELRRRRASLAWSLRRAQPYAVLDGLTQFMGCALRICFYAEGLAPPPAKWLNGAGLRTSVGKGLRAALLDLLSSLGDTAVLGGSLRLSQNRLYQRCERVEAELARALRERGFRPLRAVAAARTGQAKR